MPINAPEPHDQDLYPPTTDVGAERIARVYAEALLNAAQKQGKADEVLEELTALIRDVFAGKPQLEAFLASSAMGRDRKRSAIQAAFAGRADEVLVNFLLVLNAHDRMQLIRPILTAARALSDERARRVHVEIRSAVPLHDDQRERLRQQLQASLHKEPIMEIRIDPDLIGGLVVRVGDWIYDGSVRTQFGKIRNQLIERSSYEIQSRRDSFSSANGD